MLLSLYMTLQPYIKLDTHEVKNIIAGCLKMAKQPEFEFTIESIIPLAEGNGEWSLSFMVSPVSQTEEQKKAAQLVADALNSTGKPEDLAN